MSVITTHVLDTARGCPAAGVPVRLEHLGADGSTHRLASGITDDDGRVTDLGPDHIEPGTYRLVFDVAAYFAATGQATFFPQVDITFVPAAEGGQVRHHHVPLLLNPFAFTTYRGS